MPSDLRAPGATRIPDALRRLLGVGNVAIDTVLALALTAEIAAVLLGVAARTIFGYGLLWTDEISKIALSIIAFVGGAAGYRDNHHAYLRLFLDRMPERGRSAILVFVEWLIVLVAGLVAWASLALIEARSQEVMPILGISGIWVGLPLTVGVAMVAVYAIERLGKFETRLVVLAGIAVGALVLLIIGSKSAWLPWLAGDGALTAALLLFLVGILLGMPVGFSLLLSTIIYLYGSGNVPLVAVPQNMLDGASHFLLLALPFFILAGIIMERGGISLRLVRLVQALIGHVRGGLLQVMVLSMYLVSGLSGSKIADVAAVGSVTRDMLRREGYSLAEGASVLAVSAAMGETIPPSIPMLLLGSITSVSIAALFLGGLVPAAVVALCIMALIFLRARRLRREVSRRASWRAIGRAGLGAVLPLLMPVFLFAGILSGVATPTEVSSFAVIYGLLLACVLYREMTLGQVWRAVIDASILAGMVLFIVAAASAFAWTLTVASLPQRLVSLVGSLHDSRALFLAGTVPLMIVAGAILEGLPALLILAPLLMPIAVQVGVNPVHYSMVLLISMGAGAFMPPIGIGFYVCCAVCRSPIEAATRAMLPYAVMLLIGLLIVAFVPWLTLALPMVFGLGG
jgi:tripartite ATP-independent transporter DctM subunit